MQYPYVIEQALPKPTPIYQNVITTYGVCNLENINTTFVRIIADFMYEFASEMYGHNLTVTSFENFCDQYWPLQDAEMCDWHTIFRIWFYNGTEWCEWNIDAHTDDIYKHYAKMRLENP